MDGNRNSNRRKLHRGYSKDSLPDTSLLSQADVHIMQHKRSIAPDIEALSDKQIKHLRDTFLMFDKDGDGIITTEEIHTILISMGRDVAEDTVKQAIAQFDVDASGTVEFTEFLTVMAQIFQEEESEEDLIQIFRILDQDGDGSISKSDLREVIRRIGSSLTNKDVDEMLNEADKDRDGQIAYEEFVKIITARS